MASQRFCRSTTSKIVIVTRSFLKWQLFNCVAIFFLQFYIYWMNAVKILIVHSISTIIILLNISKNCEICPNNNFWNPTCNILIIIYFLKRGRQKGATRWCTKHFYHTHCVDSTHMHAPLIFSYKNDNVCHGSCYLSWHLSIHYANHVVLLFFHRITLTMKMVSIFA